jgi:hypothetical protein
VPTSVPGRVFRPRTSQQRSGGREDERTCQPVLTHLGIGHRASLHFGNGSRKGQQDGSGRVQQTGTALPCVTAQQTPPPCHVTARTHVNRRAQQDRQQTAYSVRWLVASGYSKRSRAPRGKRETRPPSLKVTKPLLLVSRAKARRLSAPWVCTKHAVQRDDATASAGDSSTRRTHGDLSTTGCTTPATLPPAVPTRASPLPAATAVAACVCASEWCAVVQESSIRGKGWGTCSKSKPTPQTPRVRLVLGGAPHVRAALDNGHRTGSAVSLPVPAPESPAQGLPFKGEKLAEVRCSERVPL